MIKLERQSNNSYEVSTGNGRILFSYETPIAVQSYGNDGTIYVDDCPVWGSNTGYSKTTRRHLKEWLMDEEHKVVPHDNFKHILEGL